jgi:Reverse transcriptase (RNA-dependent DNA polymerase)
MTVYKAQLVAKYFKQILGVDYDKIFSPVAMFKSIQMLLAIAAFYDYEIWKIDVKTVFLNKNLENDVYMIQFTGFEDPKNAEKICKLLRSIYGLKQVPRSWNLRFDEEVKKFIFIRCEEEPCVYRKTSGSVITFLILYVDDILLMGNDILLLQLAKSSLKKVFSIKYLGETVYILGIKIYRDRFKRLIKLSQNTYIDKVLNWFSMQNSKKGFLPMNYDSQLSKTQYLLTTDEQSIMSRVPYASAIGSIMYVILCTRPDVLYALSVTNKYQANPIMEH